MDARVKKPLVAVRVVSASVVVPLTRPLASVARRSLVRPVSQVEPETLSAVVDAYGKMLEPVAVEMMVPVASMVPPKNEVPPTVRRLVGDVVAIPTLPPSWIVRTLVAPSKMLTMSAVESCWTRSATAPEAEAWSCTTLSIERALVSELLLYMRAADPVVSELAVTENALSVVGTEVSASTPSLSRVSRCVIVPAALVV